MSYLEDLVKGNFSKEILLSTDDLKDGSNPTENNDEDLEVYKTAKRFNAAKIFSGNKFSTSELEKFVSKNYGSEGLLRYNIAKVVIKKHNLTPSKDMLLAIACNTKSKIILATAGAGKTTALQIDIEVSKIVDAITASKKFEQLQVANTDIKLSRILYLNYNRHNTQPIINRHREMVLELNRTCEPKISDDIESVTVHKFCMKWLEAFKDEIGVEKIQVINPNDKTNIWRAVIEPRWKKYYGCLHMPSDIDIDSLYNYKEESLLDWDSFFKSAEFINSGFNEDFVKSCIEKYNSMKVMMKQYDFVDFIKLMIDVLDKSSALQERIAKRYSMVIADECQDFTPLMNKLLLKFQEFNIRIIAVGDTDQTIYAFKGASPDNILTLSENLKGCSILGLDTNYRCPDNIVNAAKKILDLNILKFNKDILTVKSGGIITYKECATQEEQINMLINTLMLRTEEELNNSVITFRNKESAITLTEKLFFAGLPFKCIDIYKPFTNEVFSKITQILNALHEKDNSVALKCLWMVLPINKQLWHQIVAANLKRRTSHIEDMTFDEFVLPQSFKRAFDILINISRQIDSVPTFRYIDDLLNSFNLYYFKFITSKMQENESEKMGLYLSRVREFYMRDILFTTALKEIARAQSDNSNGIAISTMHALKGLEYDYVYVIDFNDSIFPNYSLIEQLYPANTAIEEKESENRLCYVLLTRAKKEIFIMYNKYDPSLYVQLLRNSGNEESISLIDVKNTENERTDSVEDLSSKIAFIKRLTC